MVVPLYKLKLNTETMSDANLKTITNHDRAHKNVDYHTTSRRINKHCYQA